MTIICFYSSLFTNDQKYSKIYYIDDYYLKKYPNSILTNYYNIYINTKEDLQTIIINISFSDNHLKQVIFCYKNGFWNFTKPSEDNFEILKSYNLPMFFKKKGKYIKLY